MKKVVYKTLESFFKKIIHLSLMVSFEDFCSSRRVLYHAKKLLWKSMSRSFLRQKFFTRNFYRSKNVKFIIIIFYMFCISLELYRIIVNKYYFMLINKIFYYLLYKLCGNIYINFIYNLAFIDFLDLLLKNIVIISDKINKNSLQFSF